MSLRALYLRYRKHSKAIDAYRSAVWTVERDVKWKLLGLPNPPAFMDSWSCYVRGHLVEFRVTSDSYRDCHCYDDFKLVKNSQPRQRNDTYRVDSTLSVVLKEWTEDDAYRNLRQQKIGKAEARARAIADRQAQVRRARDIDRGNVSYVWIFAECEDLGFEDSLSCVEASDDDALESFVRDALESVLRQAQSVKEAA